MFMSIVLAQASGLMYVGYGVLAMGVLVTALSSQRHLLVYLLAGMAFWTLVEMIHLYLMSWFELSALHGYVLAVMGLSWLPLLVWLVYQYLYQQLIKINKSDIKQPYSIWLSNKKR